jgi:hypothetical protein
LNPDRPQWRSRKTKEKTMTKQSATKRPTHTAYAVDGEGDKATWTELGALWPHEDGKGFNLALRALPIGGRLVIRQRKANGDRGAGA